MPLNQLSGGSSSRCGVARRPRGLSPRAQPTRLPTIGYLDPTTRSAESQRRAAFVERLRELGWIEGRGIAIECRWAVGRNERPAETAAEFVPLKVDVIVASATSPTVAAKQARSVIQIVSAAVGGPLGAGAAKSLARPVGKTHSLSL